MAPPPTPPAGRPADELAAALAGVVGAPHVLTDPQLTASYETDWTRRFHGRARLVVRPRTTGEVAAVVRACAERRVGVVAQGGNTGLVGGGVPRAGEVVLSLARLADLGPVDLAAAQVTVGAGVTVAALQSYVRPCGLDFGIDLAARDSATVGGLIATDAGGERVVRYGGMRAAVLGVEAVLADGTVVRRLQGLPKDNVGYDLAGLLVGSEGTLAVVTRARLRLVPRLARRAVAVVAVAGIPAALDVLGALRSELSTVEAAELFFADGLRLVCEASGQPPPFPASYPAYLLVECAARTDPTDELAAALERSAGAILDAALASDGPSRERLWRYREGHTEAINAAGVPLKLDVAVPVAALAAFVDELRGLVAELAPTARLFLFGHLNEGNLHVNVLDAADREGLTDAILRLVAERGGSISAEHGVGQAKVRWVHLSRSREEIAAMWAIKRALDPYGILNPGVLLPAGEPRASV